MAGQGLPVLALAVQLGEQQPQIVRRLLVVEVALDRRDRAVGVAGGDVGPRQLVDHAQALAPGHGAEQALEPRHRLRRLAAPELQPGQRPVRVLGRGQRDHPLVAGDRALDLAGLVLGDGRGPRPQLGRLGDVAGGLELAGLILEQLGQGLVLALAGEQRRDRVDRRIVAGDVGEVGLQGLEPAALLLDHADQARELEPQVEPAVAVLLEPELELAQAEQLGGAALGLEQRAEAIDDLEVGAVVGQHAAVDVDRGRAIAEAGGGQLGRAQAQLAPDRGGERQAGALDQQVDRGPDPTVGPVEVDQAVDRPPRHRLGGPRRADRRGAAPGRGRPPEHLAEDGQRVGAQADLAGGVGGLDQDVEIARIGVGQPAQEVEQRRRRAAGPGQRDHRPQRLGAITARGEGLGVRGDRGVAVAAAIAVPHGEPGPQHRGDRRRQLGGARGLLEAGGQLVDGAGPALGGGLLERGEQGLVEALLAGGLGDDRVGGERPLALARRQPDHAGDRGLVAGIDLEHGDQLAERPGLVAEVTLEQAGPLDPQVRGLVSVAGQGRDGGAERAIGDRVVAGLLGEIEDLADHDAVARRQRQGLGEVAERDHRLAGVVEREVGGFAEDRQPAALVGGVGQAGRDQAEEAGPVLLLAEAGGQGVGGGAALAGLVEERLEAGPGRRVGRLDRQRGAERAQRALGLAQVLGQRVAEAVEPGGGAVDVLAAGPLEQLGQLLPAAGRGQQLGQRADGLGVVAERGRDPLPGRDRAGAVVQVVLAHHRDPGQVGPLLGRRRRLAGPQLERGDQRRPALHALEQRDHRVERAEVTGVAVDALLPQGQRAIVLAQGLGQAGGVADHDLAGRRRRLEGGQPGQDLEALARAIDPRVQLGQPAADVELLGGARALEGQRLLVQLDRAGGVLEQIEPGPRGLGQQLDLAAGGLGVLGGGGDAVGVAGVVVRALRELAQLLLGDRRLRGQRQQRGVVIHRRAVVVELGQAGAGLLAQGPAAVGIDRDHPLEHADDLARPVGGVVVGAQEIERAVALVLLGVGGLDDPLEQRGGLAVVLGPGQHHPHRRQRARRVLEVVELAGRDPGPALLALDLAQPLEPALPQRDQLGPALVALEQALERRLQLRVVGGQRQQALLVADRLLGLVGDVLGQLRGLAQQLDAPGRVLDREQRAVVEPEQIGPALAVGVEHAQALQRLLRLRRQVEDLDQDALGDLGLVAEPLVAERRRALADHLDHLRVEPLLQHVAVQRDHVVGAVGRAGELFGLIPGRHGLGGGLDGGGG